VTEVSEHVYTARVMPANRAVKVQGGSITLDASAIPHVTGELVLVERDTYDFDPRTGARLEVTAVRDGGAPRVFDLGIREVSPNRADGTMTVRLASDEALLQDFAQLDGDEFMRGATSSLRTVIDHVLGYFGAALEPGGPDADVAARWKCNNRVLNPRAEDTWGYVLGTNAKNLNTGTNTPYLGARYVTWTSVAAGDANLLIWIDNPVKPGDILSAEARVRTGTAGRPMKLTLRYRDAEGNTILESSETVAAATGTGWTQVGVFGSGAPEGAVTVSLFASGVASAVDQTFAIDFPSLVDGFDPVTPFHGEMPDDADYAYVWAGGVDRSVSTRVPFNERRPETLSWGVGVTAMGFLEPLLKMGGLRLVCDEQRRWTTRDETYVEAGVQVWYERENITDGSETLSREDGAWFDAAVYEYTWTDEAGVQHTRYDSYGLTATPAKVARFQVEGPFPGRGRAEAMVKRAQGRGRVLAVTGIPSWTERTDQETAVRLNVWEHEGIASSVRYSLDDDTVTVTVRTDEVA
jgi:hypothetical protein